MAELQVADFPVSPAPNERVTKDSELYELLAVNATFDGSAASGDWLPAVEIVSSAGRVVARHVAGEAVAAGDSAEVTFAPFLGRSTQTHAGDIRFNFDNEGGYLDIFTHDVSPNTLWGMDVEDDSGGGIALQVLNNGGMDLISTGTEGRGVGTYVEADSGITLTTSDESVRIVSEQDDVDVTVQNELIVRKTGPALGSRLFSVDSSGIVTVEQGPLNVFGLVTASSGIDNGGNRITNGADGIDPTDFATVEQLTAFTGVESIARAGDTPLTGDVTLSEGANVTLTQVGQDIEIATTPGSGGIDYDIANTGDWLDIEATGADAGGFGVAVESTVGSIFLHSTDEAQLSGDGATRLVSGLTTLFVSPGFVQAFLESGGVFQVLDLFSSPTLTVAEGWIEVNTSVDSGSGWGFQVQDTSPGGIQLDAQVGQMQLNAATEVSSTSPNFVVNTDDTHLYMYGTSGGGPVFQFVLGTAGIFQVLDAGNAPVFEVDEVGAVGFFGVSPVAQQATPVTLGDVIALLQAYGLAA